MRAREVLKKHLLGDRPERPKLIPLATGNTGNTGNGAMAIVTMGRLCGRITLAGPDGDVTLLADGTREISRFALPPGSYRLRDSRLAMEQDGTWWFLSSSTGPHREPVELIAGSETKFDPGNEVHFKPNVKRQANGIFLGFGFTTKDRRGLSVFKDGRRIVMWYQLLAADGGVLAEGPLKYG